MTIKNLATSPGIDHICIGLHPGAVDTCLSKPFRKNIAPGKLFTPARSATAMLGVLDGLTPTDSGKCFASNGAEILP